MHSAATLPPWWERWADWWNDQQRYLRLEDPSGQLETVDEWSTLVWKGRLTAAGRQWSVEIVFGPGTPFVPPGVFPMECQSRVHQLRDGSMCLSPPGRLEQGYSGVPDLGFWLKQAKTWFDGYARQGWEIDAVSWLLSTPHRPGPGYRPELSPSVLIGLPPAWRDGPPAPWGIFRVLVPKATGSEPRAGLGTITGWCHPPQMAWKRWEVAPHLVDGASEERLGVWYQVDSRDSQMKPEKSLQEYRRLHRKALQWANQAGQKPLLISFCAKAAWGEDTHAWTFLDMEQVPVLAASITTQGLPSLKEIIELGRKGDLLWRGISLAQGALDVRQRQGRSEAIHQRISAAQVLLVGVGSLGSEVAHLLAQEGISRFLLIDGDLMLPGNAARHHAGISESGRAKVDVVQRSIQRVNPSAEIVPMHGWLDESVHDLFALSSPKQGTSGPSTPIALGLSGDEASEHLLGELCSHFRIPCLHGWLELDGRILRLFRVVPGQDPSLLELARNPSKSIPGLPRVSASPKAAMQCAESVLTGSASNVHAAANFVARTVLDLIAGASGPENHWLFSPGGVHEPEFAVPDPLRNRYGVAAYHLPSLLGGGPS